MYIKRWQSLCCYDLVSLISPAGMKSIRLWLQSRFSSAELLAAAEEGATKKKERVITPDTIPEFVIPPKHLPLKRHLSRALSDQSSQCSSFASTSSDIHQHDHLSSEVRFNSNFKCSRIVLFLSELIFRTSLFCGHCILCSEIFMVIFPRFL